MKHDEASLRFRQVLAGLDANAWLERRLIERYEDYRQSLPREERDGLEEKKCIGLLKGRLVRPVLRHFYLLGYYPLSDAQLLDKADRARYNFEIVRYHYRFDERNGHVGAELAVCRAFPQAFLIRFLESAMQGDISRGSANKIITVLTSLGLLTRIPCIAGNGSYALKFGPELRALIEEWIDRGTPVKGRTPC